MVDKDELTWQHMTHKESQEAAYIELMKNSQETAEYKTQCMNFVRALKEKRAECPNDQEFGAQVDKMLGEI